MTTRKQKSKTTTPVFSQNEIDTYLSVISAELGVQPAYSLDYMLEASKPISPKTPRVYMWHDFGYSMRLSIRGANQKCHLSVRFKTTITFTQKEKAFNVIKSIVEKLNCEVCNANLNIIYTKNNVAKLIAKNPIKEIMRLAKGGRLSNDELIILQKELSELLKNRLGGLLQNQQTKKSN